MSVDAFLTYLTETRHFTSHTTRSYRSDLNEFMAFIAFIGHHPLSVDRTVVIQYLDQLREKGRSPSTISRRLSAISSYYQWLMKRGVTEINPAKKIKRTMPPKYVYRTLNREIIDIIIFALPNSLRGCRSKLIIHILVEMDLPLSVLAGLKLSDLRYHYPSVDEPRANFLIDNSIYQFNDIGNDLLTHYINRRKAITDGLCDSLFVSSKGKELTLRSIRRGMKGISQKAQIQISRFASTLRASGRRIRELDNN